MNFKSIIVVLLAVNCCQSINFVEICEHNLFDTINTLAPYGYLITKPSAVGSQVKASDEMTIFYNRYTNRYMLFDTNLLVNKRLISSFFMEECTEEVKKSRPECVGLIFKDDGVSKPIGLMKFYDIFEHNQWIKYNYHLELASLVLIETEMAETGTELITWPPLFVDNPGVGTYSPHLMKLIYVITQASNGQHILFTRTVLQMESKQSWTQHPLQGFDGKVFASIFYWHKTQQVLAQIADDKHQPNSLAPIYEFDDTANTFVKSNHLNAKTLFDCDNYKITEKSNQILIIILSIVAFLMLIITAVVFVFFIWTVTKSEPNERHG